MGFTHEQGIIVDSNRANAFALGLSSQQCTYFDHVKIYEHSLFVTRSSLLWHNYASHLSSSYSGLLVSLASVQLFVEHYSPLSSLRSSHSQLSAALRIPLFCFGSPNYVPVSFTPISGLALILRYYGTFFSNLHSYRLFHWLVVSFIMRTIYVECFTPILVRHPFFRILAVFRRCLSLALT